jgi:NAD(P)-dependent dehydrogenase (short-subunit alcohol dehydrogenase family)
LIVSREVARPPVMTRMTSGSASRSARLSTPLADYDQVMTVNVRGYLLHAQHAYPYLARRRGCMIHVASDAGTWGEQAIALY